LHRFDTDHKCDKQTNGRTDTSTMAKTREALHAVARKKAHSSGIREAQFDWRGVCEY